MFRSTSQLSPRGLFAGACLLLAAVALSSGERAAAQRPRLFRTASRAAAVTPLSETMGAAVQRERERGPARLNAREQDVEVEQPETDTPEELFLPGHPQRKTVPSALAGARPRAGERVSPAPSIQFDTLPYTGAFPPDDGIAMGPTHLVSAGNSSVQVWTPSGSLVSTVTLGNFFPTDTTGFVFDPRACYDAPAGRFILTALSRKLDAPRASNLLIAVSATSDPTGVWNKYVIPFGRGGSPLQEWADLGCVGYDGSAIYVAANMFAFDNSAFAGARIATLDKSAAMAGHALQPILIDNPLLPTPPFVADRLASSFRPVEAWSPLSSGLLVTNGGNAGLVLYRISSPLTAPQLTATFVDITDISAAGGSPQPGGNASLDAGGTNLQKSFYRDGVLWTALTRGAVNPGDKGVVTLYRVDPTGNGLLLNSATISDPNLAFSFPAVAPDAHGNAVMVFQGSSATSLPAIYHARYDGASGTFDAPVMTRQGSSPYVHLLDGKNRWGDYTDAAPDPTNGAFVWVQGAVANTASTWQMHAARVASSDPGPQPPPVPGNLQAAATSAAAVHLSWTLSGAPDNVQVERKSGAGGFALMQTLAGTATSLDDAGLKASATYAYRLRAVKGGLFSSYTPEVSATTQAGIASFVLKSATVKAGKPASGTVTLSGPAPTGGARVALSSSNPALAIVPATVTVKARKTSAAVKITTRKGKPGAVTLIAALNGGSVPVTLQTTP